MAHIIYIIFFVFTSVCNAQGIKPDLEWIQEGVWSARAHRLFRDDPVAWRGQVPDHEESEFEKLDPEVDDSSALTGKATGILHLTPDAAAAAILGFKNWPKTIKYMKTSQMKAESDQCFEPGAKCTKVDAVLGFPMIPEARANILVAFKKIDANASVIRVALALEESDYNALEIVMRIWKLKDDQRTAMSVYVFARPKRSVRFYEQIFVSHVFKTFVLSFIEGIRAAQPGV